MPINGKLGHTVDGKKNPAPLGMPQTILIVGPNQLFGHAKWCRICFHQHHCDQLYVPIGYDGMLMICEHDALSILYFMVVAPLTSMDV